MALILDVARFKYPPHWVPLELLWEAMDLVDGTTGQRRGFMIISRPHRDPGMLYTLSCKHESWAGIAKGLVDEVPLLLMKSENVRDIRGVISVIFTSLPSNFGEFIKWVAEVRRGGDVGRGLSHEEKGRLAIKEEVLKQVKETGLYKHVADYLSWASSCCTKIPSSDNDSLSNIAASVCCQGADILAGKFSSSKGYYCLETCVKSIKDNGEKPVTVISGTAMNGNTEHGVDILVPSSPSHSSCCHSGQSNCTRLHPASNDVLTALLLALPRETWSGIRDEKLLQEIYSLVATDNLPILLQEEVLHLRRQLFLLKRCGENKADEDLCAPLF